MTLILRHFSRTRAWAGRSFHLGNKSGLFPRVIRLRPFFIIQSGRIKLSVIAKTGKEAIVALLALVAQHSSWYVHCIHRNRAGGTVL
jgi:hypothetical protein